MGRKSIATVLAALGRVHQIVVARGVEVRQRYGVSISRQAFELPLYYWRFGMGRAEYYMFELFRSDLSDDDRRCFLSQNAWTALSSIINQPIRNSDDSKLLLSRRFQGARLPTPRTLAYTSPNPSLEDRRVPEFVPLENLPPLISPTGCVIKRDHSTWGLGVHVFDRCADGIFHHVDGRQMGIEQVRSELLKRAGGYLVQERLKNHPQLAFLGLPSLASLRILTYGAPDNVKVARAAFKLPVGRKGVDNYHAGGIAAPVDLESGTIGRGVAARGLDWVSEHPETGAIFAGVRVPDWDQVLSLTIRAAQALPDFPCVGWDLAATPEGPVILEGNSIWGTDIVQRPHRRGIWEGEFRDWCLQRIRGASLERSVRRWIRCP